MQIRDLIKHLETYYKPEDEILAILWGKDDILGQAEDRGLKMTNEQATEVIEALENKHDATIGINWDVIDCYIDDFLGLPEIEE